MTPCVYSLVSVVSVGGFESVNKLAVLSPWLAAVGVVGCVGTARTVALTVRFNSWSGPARRLLAPLANVVTGQSHNRYYQQA